MVAFLLAQVAGCGTAKLVDSNARGGTVLLSGMRFEAMSQAGEKMQTHCNGPYSIVSEADEANGDRRVSFVCGGVHGLTDSEYPPRGYPSNLVPNSSGIGIR